MKFISLRANAGKYEQWFDVKKWCLAMCNMQNCGAVMCVVCDKWMHKRCSGVIQTEKDNQFHEECMQWKVNNGAKGGKQWYWKWVARGCSNFVTLHDMMDTGCETKATSAAIVHSRWMKFWDLISLLFMWITFHYYQVTNDPGKHETCLSKL